MKTPKARHRMTAHERDHIVAEMKAGRVPMGLDWSADTMGRLLVVALKEMGR